MAPQGIGAFDRETWTALSRAAQRSAMGDALVAGLDRDVDLEAEVITPAGWLTFVLRHRVTGIALQLVPGGTFERGWSVEEEGALREDLEAAGDDDATAALSLLDDVARGSRPVVTTRIPAFLLSPAPLDQDALSALVGGPPGGLLPGCLMGARVTALVPELAAQRLRLPSEAEHEYAYRAGTSGPFPWGRSRPRSPRVPLNDFGFERMAEWSEVCADGWHPDHTGAEVDGSPRAPGHLPLAVRGGSAEVWPWQGVGEWVSMLSAARSSSAEHEGFLRIRVARSLVLPQP